MIPPEMARRKASEEISKGGMTPRGTYMGLNVYDMTPRGAYMRLNVHVMVNVYVIVVRLIIKGHMCNV
jgi:hypothetical protein